MYDPAGLSRELMIMRTARRESLRDVAAGTGLAHSHIARLENPCSCNPTARTLVALADHYGCPVAALIKGAFPPKTSK